MDRLNRRRLLKGTAALGGLAVLPTSAFAAPALIRQTGDDPTLGPYQEAKIDWRQAEGESIALLVTPAHYFEKFRAVTEDVFTELTGIEVQFEVIPPKELREKAVLDLAAGSGNYASHTGDPMYLPLYQSNEWVDPLDDYLNDPTLTDPAWFAVDDIIPNWIEADSVDGTLYGMPVEGEATIHIYRSDIYQEMGIQPPQTLEELAQSAAAIHTPDRAGMALRGFQGAGQNMYIFPSLFLEFGGEWFDADGNPTLNSAAGVDALQYYVDVLQYAPAGVENWNWPEIMEAFAGGGVAQYVDANSTASVIENPASSTVVGKVGYQRWPAGPSGRRVTSIW
ncbi:MAG: extracellular solute-binding protein, partial [Chloroflexia bacterium]|nr:extracellular solute-binding protein [Chloroflexia bacterium]